MPSRPGGMHSRSVVDHPHGEDREDARSGHLDVPDAVEPHHRVQAEPHRSQTPLGHIWDTSQRKMPVTGGHGRATEPQVSGGFCQKQQVAKSPFSHPRLQAGSLRFTPLTCCRSAFRPPGKPVEHSRTQQTKSRDDSAGVRQLEQARPERRPRASRSAVRPLNELLPSWNL